MPLRSPCLNAAVLQPDPDQAPYAHLAGVQLKLELASTWACDDCWAGQVKHADFVWKEPNQ